MITNFKIFENVKNNNHPRKSFWESELSRLKNTPYKTFNLEKLNSDCEEYHVSFFDLLREMVLGKTIAFQCIYCCDNSFELLNYKYHNMLGKCVDIQYDPDYMIFEKPASDIVVKMEDNDDWHTIFETRIGDNRKVRIYNYEEGDKIENLNMLKNTEKYNL